MITETIVAISTCSGSGLRGIVRLSGPDSLRILKSIFVPPRASSYQPYSAVEGRIEVAGLSVPCSCYIMLAPLSYTKEDIVEFHTLSSPLLLQLLLEEAISLGARLAEPGEFTRRAFLNGRLDLAQAESVLSIIHAQSREELTAGVRTLRGVLGGRLRTVRDSLLALLTHIELSLDFSDQDIELISQEELLSSVVRAEASVSEVLSKARPSPETKARVAIVGRPNVGKSSLFNRLVDEQRVIVDSTPGTTRDVVEVPIEKGTVEFLLADTPGVDGELPRLDASAFVLVLDGSEGILSEDRALREKFEPALVVVNKADLPLKLDARDAEELADKARLLYASALRGDGVEKLWKAIVEIVETELWKTGGGVVISARVQRLVTESLGALREARQSVALGYSWEFTALHLREALEPICSVLGERVDRAVLDGIFSGFCIGK